jgi:quinol monooxygenase YgiN/uncharacterized protein YunC (DUF1805 family)
MKSIIASFTARNGSEQKLEEVLRRLVAETSREAGALVYDLLRQEGQKGTFIVCERYADQAAKESHLASAHLKAAIEKASGLVEGEIEIKYLDPVSCIRQETRIVGGKVIEVAVLPLGPVSLVYAKTGKGLIGCGAIDAGALGRFGIAAARIKPVGSSVTSFEDLMSGSVSEANSFAVALGISVGMKGSVALLLL